MIAQAISRGSHELGTSLLNEALRETAGDRRAQEHLARALRVWLENPGADHPWTACAHRGLADAYRTSTVWSEASRKRVGEIADVLARESSGELVKPAREDAPADGAQAPTTRRTYMPGRVEL